MFTLAIILCTQVECVSATTPATFSSETECQQAAQALHRRGLELISRGQIEPHTFEHQCIHWGRRL